MSDDRPSIAELQRIEREIGTVDWTGKDQYGAASLRKATPVLLEIAAAALVLYAPQISSEKRTAAYDRMRDALAKVRQ